MRMTAGLFRAFRSHNYRIWAVGAFVSNVGTWVQRTAQDWLVLTQLTHNNASAVGIVMALQFAPQFLLVPWSGLAADRFNQRKLVMLTQGTMGFLALVLGLMTVTHLVQLWHVYAFAFLFGCASALDAPVRQVFVSELVGDDDLPNAVALNSTSFNAARMLGPAVSGLVIAGVGTGWAFILNGLSFVAVLISLATLRRSELHPTVRAQREAKSFSKGLRYVWERRDLKLILAMLFLVGTFGLNFPIFVSTMAVHVFHADARGYGWLSSIMAVGTVSGALMGAARRELRFGSLVWSAGAFGVGCALAAAAPSDKFFAAALVLIGASALIFMNATNAWMQLSCAPAMRGRVMALRLAVALGGTPLGAPIVGRVADAFGPRWALCIGAAAGIGAMLVGVCAWVAGVRTVNVQREPHVEALAPSGQGRA